MCCEERPSDGKSDRLEVRELRRHHDVSATMWLLGQAVRYLNTDGKTGELGYTQVTGVLRGCCNDVLETVEKLFAQLEHGDTSLRWSLLYVLGDVGDERAAAFLMSIALKPLPEKRDGEGCESDRDMEMLVATQAVHALHQIATRHTDVADQILELIRERPTRPILIEAVKVVAQLGLKDKLGGLLSEDDRWILDIRQARPQELDANPERNEGSVREFTPPKFGAHYTAPSLSGHCDGKES